MNKTALILVISLVLLVGSALAQNIEYISSTLFAGPLEAVQADGDYAYFVSDDALQVFDISDPTSPIYIAGRAADSWSRDLFIANGYAYVTSGNNPCFLQIFDINDPLNPQLIGDCELSDIPYYAWSICISGQYAYITGYLGFCVVNISDPGNPVQIGSCTTMGHGYDIEVSGNYAFVVGYELEVIDISDPFHPEIATNLQVSGSEIYALDVSGYYIYLTSLGYFDVINIANPLEPYITGTLNASIGAYSTVVVQNNIAYVGQGWFTFQPGLLIVDVSDPELPSLIDYYDAPAGVTDIFLTSNFAIINWIHTPLGWWSRHGFQIIDITSPHDPVPVGEYETPFGYGVLGVCASNNLAYVAAGGFYILDVSNPSFPRNIGMLTSNNPFSDVEVSGDFAYCFNGDDFTGNYSFMIIDVSDSTNPNLVEEYADFGGRLYADGDYVFITGAYIGIIQGLSIFDVSNPYESELITTYLDGAGSDLSVAGDYAYVCGHDAELLKVIDVSEVMNPEVVGTYSEEPPASAFCISILENHTLLGVSGNELLILDISDPLNPQYTSSINLPDSPYDIFIYEDYAFVACLSEGLQIIDISDFSNPQPAGIYDTPGYPYGVYVSDNIVYVADGYSLQILQFDPESGIELLYNIPVSYELSQNYPNPFNASTTIRYDLSYQSRVTIDIYDILGKWVETIHDGLQPSGNRQVVWNAGDLPSGVYFYKLQAGEYSETRKMMLLK